MPETFNCKLERLLAMIPAGATPTEAFMVGYAVGGADFAVNTLEDTERITRAMVAAKDEVLDSYGVNR